MCSGYCKNSTFWFGNFLNQWKCLEKIRNLENNFFLGRKIWKMDCGELTLLFGPAFLGKIDKKFLIFCQTCYGIFCFKFFLFPYFFFDLVENRKILITLTLTSKNCQNLFYYFLKNLLFSNFKNFPNLLRKWKNFDPPPGHVPSSIAEFKKFCWMSCFLKLFPTQTKPWKFSNQVFRFLFQNFIFFFNFCSSSFWNFKVFSEVNFEPLFSSFWNI